MKNLALITAIILTASTLFGQVVNSEQSSSARNNQEGWPRDGYDLGWSYHYPFDTDIPIQNNPFVEDWSINAENPEVRTGDINGDDLQEIIYSTNNILYVLDGQGNELWSMDLGYIDVGNYKFILDDVTEDGIPEIILNTRINDTLKLLFYDGYGNLIKEISMTEQLSVYDFLYPRAVTDIDSDGDLEVVFFRMHGLLLWSRAVGVFDYNSGELEWVFPIGPFVRTINIADVTGDSNKEIVFGGGGSCNGHTVNGSSDCECYSFCLDKDGNLLWSQQFEGWGFVDSEVSVHDLDGDGKNEVIYTSREHGWQWWDGNLGRIYLLNPDNGEIIKEYNAGKPLIVNGIADLTGDNKKEILVNYQDGFSQTGKILMFDDSLNLLNEYVVSGSILRVCAINDLNGDGHLEIIVRKIMTNEFVVLDDNFNELWSLSYDNEVRDVIPTDLDVDGINELIISTSQNLHVLRDTSGPTVTVISPNGGEYWQWDTQQSISWTSTSVVIENINIWLSYNGGLTYNDLLFENIANDGEEPWTVPEAQCNTARIKIEGFDTEGVLVAEDESNGDFFIYTIPPVSLDSGLVAFYPFNGNAIDESGNGNDGIVYGATLSNDRFGDDDKAYGFDGQNDYVDCGSDSTINLSNSFSISSWIYYSSGDNIVGKEGGDGTTNGYYLWIEQYSRIVHFGFNGGQSEITSLSHIDTNKWINIVGVWNSATKNMAIYINGILDYQHTYSGNPLPHSNPLYIGHSSATWAGQPFFNGKIDDLRIYDRALNEFEIQTLYHEGDWKIKPSFIIELSDKAVCKNDSVAFEAIVEGIPPINYQWQKDGIDIPGATDSVILIPHVQPEDDGEYRCIATNEYGTGTSNTAILSVEFAIPTIIVGHTSVIEYQVATYSVDMQEGHTYEFGVEGGNKIDGTENSITIHWGASGHGFVKLIETSELGCIADTNILNVTIGVLGIDDKEAQNLSIYPNPFNGKTTIYYSLTEPSLVSLQIYNTYGQLIDTPVNSYHHNGNHRVQWKAEGLPAGIYLIHLIINKKIITKKIIKL